ncbi:uncharacterized protein LOC132519889 isoform X2 [Lagenorhynchus albirostris]|uniref:uncharacterized protein LOC132519889 isoform X2 n=1 Tax=Lagenorhynchus albirostris TaxID=27610 RepID=UPI0028E899E2|nr:uncharacterized protein LOC132519889 isoform X2 [Lagenorhynchus albirostris]
MQQNRPGRGPLSVGSGRGGSARGQGSPGLALRGGPTRPSGARGRTRGLGREPAWVGEAESSDSPGRRGSHSLPSETPPHSAAYPPSRGWLLRGCSSPAGRRAAVSPRRAPAVRLPRAAAAARQPCAVLESAVAAAGKGCGIAALRLILDDAASASTPSARSRSSKKTLRWITGRAVEFAGVSCGLNKHIDSISDRQMAHVAGGCHIDIAVLEDGESYDTINLIKRSYYCWIVQDI